MPCWPMCSNVKGIQFHAGLYVGMLWELNVILVCQHFILVFLGCGLFPKRNFKNKSIGKGVFGDAG